MALRALGRRFIKRFVPRSARYRQIARRRRVRFAHLGKRTGSRRTDAPFRRFIRRVT